MAIVCERVLILPAKEALMFRLSLIITILKPVMKNSRTKIKYTIQALALSRSKSPKNAAKISILSANGSSPLQNNLSSLGVYHLSCKSAKKTKLALKLYALMLRHLANSYLKYLLALSLQYYQSFLNL